MKRLLLIAFLAALSCALQAAAPPNVLFIYADDWGWGDLGCHGHPHLKTPNIDRLAREGTDFQQFVVCNPVCSPSRTAIVTGQYPVRHLVHQHFASHDENVARGMPDWLDPKATLLPRLMKEAGYTTAHFGKWHLSGQGAGIDAPLPAEYGYDDAAVWTGPGRGVFEGTTVAKRAGDAHDKQGAAFQTIAAAEHVLKFIREAKGQPFYINFWLHETHHLVAATEEQKAQYPDTPEPQRTFYAAITRADAQIGRVLDLLDELKLADNTLVFFSSDNGPENSQPRPTDKFYYSVGTTGGLRGRKRSLYLGGVNVPFLVRWPGQVPAGRVDKESVLAGVDVLPTILAAAGVPVPAGYHGDGKNVLSVLRGESMQRDTPLFWEWRGPHAQDADWPTHAIRDGDYVLLHDETATRTELYNVIEDRSQEHDIASANPELTASMKAKLDSWRSTLVPFVQSPQPDRGRKKAAPSKATAISRQDRSVVFKRWDKDHSGSLSLQEYTDGLSKKEDAKKRFENFDKNGDGSVSSEEFVGKL